jgi:hypothetical protein
MDRHIDQAAVARRLLGAYARLRHFDQQRSRPASVTPTKPSRRRAARSWSTKKRSRPRWTATRQGRTPTICATCLSFSTFTKGTPARRLLARRFRQGQKPRLRQPRPQRRRLALRMDRPVRSKEWHGVLIKIEGRSYTYIPEVVLHRRSATRRPTRQDVLNKDPRHGRLQSTPPPVIPCHTRGSFLTKRTAYEAHPIADLLKRACWSGQRRFGSCRAVARS